MKKGKTHLPLGRIAAYCLIALLLLLLCARVEARVVNVELGEAYFEALPAGFDGATVLFLTDFHVDALTNVRAVERLIDQLEPLEPDLLLLGGDYAENGNDDDLARLFALFAGFEAPLGKYAVRGECDTSAALREIAANAGVTLLEDEIVTLTRGGDCLSLIGLGAWTDGDASQRAASTASLASADGFTMVLGHDPARLPLLNNQPAQGGAGWIELFLAGHTLGGQVNPLGARLYANQSDYGERFLTGWRMENGAACLVSNGVGTRILPLRLGARPQAHYLTLHRKEG